MIAKWSLWTLLVLSGAPIGAQEKRPAPADSGPAARISSEGREALRRCREVADGAKGLRGKERAEVLANAAAAYDRLVGGFSEEKPVAAAAAFAAAELWRRHGSLPLAEKDYLLAARLDPGRYAQRGWIGAADMQRRLHRRDEALASYRKVIEIDAGNGRAQRARLEIAVLFRVMGRLGDAIAMAQVALECARPGRQTIDAANELALLWIAEGDLEAAGRALDHAERSIVGIDDDPIVTERLRKAVELMSARRALRRALDAKHDAAGDAVRLDADRRRESRGPTLCCSHATLDRARRPAARQLCDPRRRQRPRSE